MTADDDDLDHYLSLPYSIESTPADPAHPFWRAWERPACPKCGRRPPRLLTYGLPGADWEAPEQPHTHMGCMVDDVAPQFECIECEQQWGDWLVREPHPGQLETGGTINAKLPK